MTMLLAPPAPPLCPVCAVEHPMQVPHHAGSFYYCLRFLALRGRKPTWADASAHCDPDVKARFYNYLVDLNQWTEPTDGEPIADPPLESIYKTLEISDEVFWDVEQDFEKIEEAVVGSNGPSHFAFSQSLINQARQCKNVQEIELRVILPNLKQINEQTGQENDPKYLAYAMEYVLSQMED